MQIDHAPSFTPDELPTASRLLAARAKRLGIDPGLLLRAAIRDLVFDEAGRPDELTADAAERAEHRADAAQVAREEAAALAAAELQGAE